MKKITRTMFAIGVIFSSCQKEANYARNYSQPLDGNDLTGAQLSGNIAWYEGKSDEECIAQIKTFSNYDPSKPIFLSPDAYDLNESKSDISISSAKAEYILFPHAISSTSNKFGWDYLNELNELRNEYGAEGTQVFLDKYLRGDSTLGMKLNKNF